MPKETKKVYKRWQFDPLQPIPPSTLSYWRRRERERNLQDKEAVAGAVDQPNNAEVSCEAADSSKAVSSQRQRISDKSNKVKAVAQQEMSRYVKEAMDNLRSGRQSPPSPRTRHNTVSEVELEELKRSMAEKERLWAKKERLCVEREKNYIGKIDELRTRLQEHDESTIRRQDSSIDFSDLKEWMTGTLLKDIAPAVTSGRSRSTSPAFSSDGSSSRSSGPRSHSTPGTKRCHSFASVCEVSMSGEKDHDIGVGLMCNPEMLEIRKGDTPGKWVSRVARHIFGEGLRNFRNASALKKEQPKKFDVLDNLFIKAVKAMDVAGCFSEEATAARKKPLYLKAEEEHFVKYFTETIRNVAKDRHAPKKSKKSADDEPEPEEQAVVPHEEEAAANNNPPRPRDRVNTLMFESVEDIEGYRRLTIRPPTPSVDDGVLSNEED